MDKVRNIISIITSKLAYISMAVTFLLMCITTADVIIRKVSDGSILGSYEMTEMGLVLIIAIGVPYFQLNKGHVRVDIFVKMLPRRAQHLLDGLTQLASAAVMALMVYALYLQAGSYLASAAKTSVIHIPYAPFVYSMVVGYGLYAILLLIDAVIDFDDGIRYRKKEESDSDSDSSTLLGV